MTDQAYVMIQSGPYGGPLSFTNVFFDNEGYPNPGLNGSDFYAEPSLNPGPEGNRLTLSEIVDCFTLTSLNHSVITLADAPGNPVPAPKALLDMSLETGPTSANNRTTHNRYALVSCSSANWYGRVTGPLKDTVLTYGPIAYSGPANQCHIVTYVNDLNTFPTAGTWLAGCAVLAIANPSLDAAQKYTTYTCTRSGTYGVTPPEWTGSKPVN